MSVTLQQILSAVREANTNSQAALRLVQAIDNANLIRMLIDNGVFDTSGDGSQYGFKITNSGMDLYVSLTGTPTDGNYSEAVVYGKYVKVPDTYSMPFFTLADGDSTYDRIDSVYIKAPDRIAVSQGTPAATPVAADVPDDALKIAEITVPAGETDGSGITITDTRVFVGEILTKTSGTAGNFASLTADGGIEDSGKSPSDFANASHTHLVADITDFDPTTKADKVSGAVAGNLAELDASGNLVDSGITTDSVKGITADTTITFTNSTTDAWNDTGLTDLAQAIQAKIDSLEKRLSNGATLTLQFSDGTYTLSQAITVEGFYGDGYINILGNSVDFVKGTTKSVILDFSGQDCNGLVLKNCAVAITVKGMSAKVKTDVALYVPIKIIGCSNGVSVWYCNLECTSTSYGANAQIQDFGKAYLRDCYVTAGMYGFAVNRSAILNAVNCEYLTTQPQYGVYTAGGISLLSSTYPTGSVSNTPVANGGFVNIV